jgi:hypothetical protein
MHVLSIIAIYRWTRVYKQHDLSDADVVSGGDFFGDGPILEVGGEGEEILRFIDDVSHRICI